MITNLAKKKKRGFTLVEVIIVLAIIAIIAAIAIPNLTKVRTESKIKADTQSAESIRKTMLMLVTDDKIKVQSGTLEYYLKFDNKGKCDDVLFGTSKGSLKAVLAGNGIIANDGLAPGVSGSDVVEYFKDIKAPQSDGAKEVKIEVLGTGVTTGAGNIRVTVDAKTPIVVQ